MPFEYVPLFVVPFALIGRVTVMSERLTRPLAPPFPWALWGPGGFRAQAAGTYEPEPGSTDIVWRYVSMERTVPLTTEPLPYVGYDDDDEAMPPRASYVTSIDCARSWLLPLSLTCTVI